MALIGQVPSDSIVVTGHFLGDGIETVTVYQYGLENKQVGQKEVRDGQFEMHAPASIPPGMYRFAHTQGEDNYGTNIIINGEEDSISFTIDENNRLQQFHQSAINQQWQDYTKDSQKRLQNIQAIDNLLTNYSNKDDSLIQVALRTRQQITDDYNAFVKQAQHNTNSPWLKRLMKANQVLVHPPLLSDQELQDYRRTHYFEGIDTADPALIHTPYYRQFVRGYLRLHPPTEAQQTKEQQIDHIKQVVDELITTFSANEEVKEFVVEFLTREFQKIGLSEVIEHIDLQHRVAMQCTDDTPGQQAFEQRLEMYDRMAVGKKAPNIEFKQAANEIGSLYDVEAEQTLLVFWASWCPHCEEQMPKLNDWLKEHSSTQGVAISLDENKQVYLQSMLELPGFIHYSDFQKWESKPVKDYYIYATPTILLLDEEHKIQGIFDSFDQFHESSLSE